jgi:outer membrane receptor protein involved in Fe transport
MRSKQILAVLFVLTARAAAPLPAAVVRGVVRDIYGRPLPGVEIRLDDENRAFWTDHRGEFAIASAAGSGSLRLTFFSPLHHRERRILVLKEAAAPLQVLLVPLHMFKEEVSVTALDSPEKTVAVPFAQSIVSAAAIRESRPETIVQALQSSLGIHFIGKGGIAVTPSIRGLARRRVLLMAGGARIVSDRSAGASAHFFPPEMVSHIEMVRSASSVLYGSDAIGGVIQIFPRAAPEPGSGDLALNISGNTLDDRFNGGFSLGRRFGNFTVFAAGQASRAGDYSAGGERILRSEYRFLAGDLFVRYERPRRVLSLGFFKSAGRDVGKPERANDPAVASFYPAENTNLLTVSFRDDEWVRGGSLQLSLFLNPNDYELNKVKPAKEQVEVSRNEALDFGLRVVLKTEADRRLGWQLGLDYFGRTGVDMTNETWSRGALSDSSFPVRDGRRGDLGAFVVLTYAAPAGVAIVSGARLGAFSRRAVSGGMLMKNSAWAPAFFLGVTRAFGPALTLFANAGTAFRLPSLSEAYYTGITGRSSVVGRPNLAPERSLNLDVGLKVHGRNLFLGAYLFQCGIRDMIEKFPLSDTAYTYANIERGRIRGAEIEFQFRPLDKLELFANAFAYRGASTASEANLNDVPSARLFLGAKLWLGRFWGEVNWLAAAAVDRPGPAEKAIPGYQVTDFKAGCYFSARLFAFFKVANLFDRVYYANADPDIPPARGLDISLGLNLNF